MLAQLAEPRLAAYPDVPTLKEAGYDVTTTPQIRAVVAPPQMPADAAAYWEERFTKLHETPSWRKYLHDNQLEDAFLHAADLRKSIVETEKQLREQYQLAGIKTVR